MFQAVVQRKAGIILPVDSVHGLQKEVPEAESLETFRVSTQLRKDEFQLMSFAEEKISSCLGADPSAQRQVAKRKYSALWTSALLKVGKLPFSRPS